MNTNATDEFDYQEYADNHSPDSLQVRRGLGSRRERREAAKERITIRIDQDVLERFKQMTEGGQGYQSLINQALRDWLTARDVKELIREELLRMTDSVVAAVQDSEKRKTG